MKRGYEVFDNQPTGMKYLGRFYDLEQAKAWAAREAVFDGEIYDGATDEFVCGIAPASKDGGA